MRSVRRLIVTLVPPAVAAIAEWHYGDVFQPHTWYPFYPALFVSSWLGDRFSSLAATVFTVLYFWWSLTEPSHSFRLVKTGDAFGIAMLLMTGVLFTFFHDRLRRTNAQLQDSAAQRLIFEALIENSSDFIGIADARGVPIYGNPAARRMVGLPDDVAIGDTKILEYYAPAERSMAANVILPAMMNRGRWEGETAFRHWQTGAAIPVSDTHFSIREPGTARLLGYGTITRDITELKRAREELDAAKKRLEAVAQASLSVSEAIGALPEASVQGVLETITRHCRLMTGAEFAAVGLGGDTEHPFETWVFSGVDPDVAARIGRAPRRVGLLAFVTQNAESVRLRDIGTHPAFGGFPPHHPPMTTFLGVPIRSRGESVGHLYLANRAGSAEFTNEDQRVVEMLADRVGVAIETARLYAAEGMQRAWLQTIVDQMPEGIAIMDARGRVVLESRFLRSMLPPESLQHDTFGNVIGLTLRHPSGEAVSPPDRPLARALMRNEIVHGEYTAQGADGRSIPVLVSAAPARRPNGELAGATMTVHDISALKALERMREEWASIVAHDLQQPATSILLRTDMLLRTVLTDAQRDIVSRVRATALRLSRMVNDLTDASQLEASRMRVTLARLDLGALVRSVVDGVPGALERTAVRLPSEHALFVQGDAQRLEQVLGNLLSNAIKYGTPGTPIVLELKEAGEHAEVLVTNAGRGIPADELPRLFDRYMRSRTLAPDGPKGLGLGLYIAKSLIDAHRGRIWAESVPNDTTTFHFTIPLDGPPVPLFLMSPPAEAVAAPGRASRS